MKKTLIVLLCSTLAVACGIGSGGTDAGKKDSATTPATTTTEPAASPSSEKGLELIGAADLAQPVNKLREKISARPYLDVAEKIQEYTQCR